MEDITFNDQSVLSSSPNDNGGRQSINHVQSNNQSLEGTYQNNPNTNVWN